MMSRRDDEDVDLTLSDVVDKMRTVPSPDGVRPTVSQVRLLVQDMWDMLDVRVTAGRPEFAGFSEENLIDIASKFGAYRARVARGALETVPRVAATALFPFEETLRVKARELLDAGVKPFRSNGTRNTRSSRNPNGFPRELYPVLEEVLSASASLPPGYATQKSSARGSHKALAAIFAQRPEESELVRFVERTYSNKDIEVSADHVWLLRWFTSHGLTHRLLEFAGHEFTEFMGDKMVMPSASQKGNYYLSQAFIAAFDLIETERIQATTWLSDVATGRVTAPGEVAQRLRGSLWIAPVPMERLAVLAERAMEPGASERVRELFEQRLRTFQWDVQALPGQYSVSSWERLSYGQLSQIVQKLEIPSLDNAEDLAFVRETSARLTRMGLGNDRDLELPEAQRARRLGVLDEFWASREARIAGATDWEDAYREKVAEVEAG